MTDDDLEAKADALIEAAHAYYIEQNGPLLISQMYEREIFTIMAGFACKYAAERIASLREPADG